MTREQRIMERIVNEFGDEFNEYISKFYVCDLWKIKEDEVIVNKTFKKVIDVIADFNLTTTNKILDNAYNLIESNEAMFKIMDYLCSDYINNGNQSLLNRAMVFCYAVFMIGHNNNITPVDVLKKAINSELLVTKKSLWQKFLYTIKLRKLPYVIKGDADTLMLVSILKGNSAKEVVRSIAEYKELV